MASPQSAGARQCIGAMLGTLVGAGLVLMMIPSQNLAQDTTSAHGMFSVSSSPARPSCPPPPPVAAPCPSLAAPCPSLPPPAPAASATPTPYITGQDAVLRLYTEAGHDHRASAALDPARLAPLTHEAQNYIYQQQHPADCRLAKYLMSKGHVRGNGIGSIMHVSGSHLSGALESGRVFVWMEETGSEWTDVNTCGAVKNFECHFLPPSHCTLADAVAAPGTLMAEMHYGAAGFPATHVPTVLANQLRKLNPGMKEDEMKYWWRGQSVAYLMRLNAAAVAAVRSMRYDNALHTILSPHADVATRLAVVPLPPGTIHAHVRHGDKYTEMVLQSTQKYFNASEFLVRHSPMFLRRTMFVSTEDATVLTDAAAYNHTWSILYSNIARSNTGPLTQVLDLGADRAGYTARTHIMQLLLSMEADAWVTTRGSNWNRVLDELRCIWVDKCTHPISEVGTPESWENFNWR